MKHLYLLLFVFVLSIGDVTAQVTGTVVDSLKQPLPFCNVMMVREADSTVVTGTTCAADGTFMVEMKENGRFRLLVLFSGYEKTYTEVFTLDDAHHSHIAGEIVLIENTSTMNEVTITAQKPFMEQKLDRTVFNIENSVLATGNSALDVLRKLPGVTVDNNDNISVRGKQGVMFMMDGRRSYMGGSDMANYLRGIDASQIEKIEVITNPSAKYEASGNAIINIVLKRNRNLGYNQQLNASYDQGFYGGGNVGTNLNYKTEKWNFFGAADVGQWQFYEEFERTMIYSPDSASHPSSITNGRPKMGGMWNWEQAGIDYSPGKRHTIGIVAERSGGLHEVTRTLDMNTYNSEMVLDSNLYTTGLEQSRNEYYSGALNYKFDVDTTGKLLTADFNYASFTTKQDRENMTTYHYGASQTIHDPMLQVTNLNLSVGYATGQIDYVHPLRNENGLFEGGIRGSQAKTTSAARYYLRQGSVSLQDQPVNFVYTEMISAAYLNYSRSINKKLDAQFGLRAEETMSKGEDGNGTELFNRQYLRLFPSAFLNWKVDSLHAINISYSRRIERPDYGELNPFVIYNDPYTTFSGNPNLMPQMNHKVEVSHIFKGTYRTAFSYMHMTSVFNGIVSVDDSTRVVNTRLENLATYNVFTLEFSAEYSFTNWYTLSGTLLGFRDHYFGPVNGEDYSVIYYTGMIFLQNRISLKKDWGMEANFFCRSVNMNGIWRESPFSGLDIGVRKRFGDGRGSVSLNISDLLQGNYTDRTANYGNVNMSTTGKMDSRRVRLAVSWKLGRSEYERQQRQNSADELKGRAQ